MKTTLFLIATLISLSTFSQAVATFKSDPMTNYAIVTSPSTIDQTPTGANTSWTFNPLTTVGNSTDVYAAPTATQLTTYPGTTEVLSINIQGGDSNTIFLKEDGSGISITGSSPTSDITLNYNTDNAFIGLFPLSFGANNTDTVSGTFTYLTASGTFTGSVTTTIDAYGVLNFTNSSGDNYSGNVTRLRIDQTLSFSIPPIFNDIGTLTQTTYHYYDNTTENIAFRYNNLDVVSAFLGINQTTESLEYNSTLTLSLPSIARSGFQLYPNPAKDTITLNLKSGESIKTIKISDIQGKEIFTYNENATTISISNLRKGLYLITLETKSGVFQTKKFLKY